MSNIGDCGHDVNTNACNGKNDSYGHCKLSSESTAINSADSTVNIETYGTILPQKLGRFRKINKCDVLIFYFIFWNVYSSRKLLFPFSQEFSTFYYMSIESFSYVLAAYDLGGLFTILLTPFSFNNIRINLMMFLWVISICGLYIFLSFSNVFISLFIVRMLIGFICTFLQAEIRGILSTFLKKDNNDSDSESNEMAKAVIFCECGWWSSTISWVFVGIILNQSNVDYVWYYVAVCALMASICCFLLPKCTVSEAIKMRSQKQILNTDNNSDLRIWKHYHIYFCYLTLFCVALGYNAYLASFGAWMTEEFNLNPEQLGVSTLVITASELTGFLSISFLQRYNIKNMKISVINNFGGLLSIICWVIVMKLNVFNELIVWIIVFIYTVFFEQVYLSLIVVILELAPKGLESKIALFFGTVNRLSTVTGIIIGPHIVKWFSFTFLLQIILVIQCCAFICVCIMDRLWKRHNKLYTVS